MVDEDSAVDAPSWYFDGDGDGYGDPLDVLITCAQPSGYTTDGGDCDDDKTNIHPEAGEFCNQVDDNCNGTIDEDAADSQVWHPDLDGDGYGDANSPINACDQPDGYVGNGTDCDDTDATEWTEVEGLANSCTEETAGTGAGDGDKSCSAVSGLTGGLMFALVGLWGRRRRE